MARDVFIHLKMLAPAQTLAPFLRQLLQRITLRAEFVHGRYSSSV
jgi:hypothetical protein